ncbi:hypothetical protein PoB_005776000 [Plakobranchus ocellatus]|uniref:Granulins domain-containing protein n=1 Tax=Plakobranchus ocellatus TaxID=259542 RepID=A0AAV4CEM1_9GAST|nr:hypothetical protein PoB_005776000 [Plakobranchus ocellatus]
MGGLDILLFWILTSAVLCCKVNASSCSWSNEDCREDEDCCSKSCHKAHEGTNPRCRHSTLGEPCVFDYHCQDSLTCGAHYNCCSPYWKMCIKDADCCDPNHVCRSADGFYYDRCLWRSAASRPSPAGFSTAIAYLSFLCVSVLLRVNNIMFSPNGNFILTAGLVIFVISSVKCMAADGAVG